MDELKDNWQSIRNLTGKEREDYFKELAIRNSCADKATIDRFRESMMYREERNMEIFHIRS